MKITVVASELLGRAGTGGAGTADSLLAVTLARHGHDVGLLIASGRQITALSDIWTSIYDSAGVDVRVLERRAGVRPSFLAPTFEVFHALREEPPDIAIVNDWRGLGYAAQRARQLGTALTETAFVVHCHGPGRILAEFAQKVPDTTARFGEGVTERGSLELADAVVSPSTWLLDWMREHGWPVPETARVIPYISQSAALDEDSGTAPGAARIDRLAFFGQLREGKGIRIFVAALAELDPQLLDGVELVFLGGERGRWTGDRILSALAPAVKERVADISVETNLDRESALELLQRSGTLALMPSLLDNSPNTVSECLERGIPFVSTRTGGIPELVAEEDRPRVLCEPNAADLAAALRRALESPSGFDPAHPANDPRESVEAWLDVVGSVAPSAPGAGRRATHVAVVAGGAQSASRAYALAEATPGVEVEVVRAASRREGLERTSADWVVFLDEEDNPDDSFLETLVGAQAASGADLVTAAVRRAEEPDGVQLFLGDPGALGLVENQYGVVGLLRSALAAAEPLAESVSDPDWPLFARIALGGGRVLSIPDPLATHTGRPGRVGDVPGGGLAVLAAFEESRSRDLPDLPELAATLAAAQPEATAIPMDGAPPRRALSARVLTVLRREGFSGVLRRARTRGG